SARAVAVARRREGRARPRCGRGLPLGDRRGAGALRRRRQRVGARARPRPRGGARRALSAEADAEPDFPVVAGYAIERVIGRGAQGTVYLARRQDDLGREVALKHFPPAGRGAYRREIETWREIEAARRDAA